MVGVPAVWEGVVAKVNLGNPITKKSHFQRCCMCILHFAQFAQFADSFVLSKLEVILRFTGICR